MEVMDKFLIFADGRTGSSNLAKSLRKLYGSMSLEPFNAGKSKYNGDVGKFIKELNSSDDIGVKHLSCQLSHGKNIELSSCFDKIVFLYRGNILQQAISWEISAVTGDWYFKDRIMEKIHMAKDISFNRIMTLVAQIKDRQDVYRKHFEISSNLIVKYEDLYNGRTDEINRVMEYLGYPKYSMEDEDVNKMFFSMKINDTNSYKTLKCYQELKKMGNDEIGFLE